MSTNIPYVDEGWGLFVGCTKYETGCLHCWADGLHTKRHKAYKAGKKMPRQYAKPFRTVQFLPERLDLPARWRKPRDIFVCPMSDFFHVDISPCDRARAIQAMEAAPRHRYFIFTKRIERAQSFFSMFATPLPNLWLIMSLSTQEEADRKIPLLLNTNVAHRGLSLEPLIEEIDVTRYVGGWDKDGHCKKCGLAKEEGIEVCDCPPGFGPKLNWVVVGAESGSHRRFCDIKWVRSIVRQCQAADVMVYVKQLDDPDYKIDGKVVTDSKDFPEDLRVRQYPE